MFHKILNNKILIFLRVLYSAILERRTDKKYFYIIQAFFNMDKACPPQIQDCEQLRIDFLADLNKYKKFNICMTCDVLNIKRQYIQKIKQRIYE